MDLTEGTYEGKLTAEANPTPCCSSPVLKHTMGTSSSSVVAQQRALCSQAPAENNVGALVPAAGA